MIHRHFLSALVAVMALGRLSLAQEVQTDPQTGVQYQITGRSVTQRPVSETRIEQRPYTVYTERLTTEYQPSYRSIYTPVTEYSWEPYMANRWNPFSQPTVAYKYVPHTRWDSRVEESQIPLTRHDFVPEQRVAQVPVTTQRMVSEEHITRMAMTGNGSDPFASRTASTQIGGVANLQAGDPPKQGNGLSGSGMR
jgi:hypothetical protein